MPWWKRVEKPEAMTRPDVRTERVIERLEMVAERMEKVASVLSDDMDREDEEQRVLRAVIRDAQGGRPGPYGTSGDEDGGSDA